MSCSHLTTMLFVIIFYLYFLTPALSGNPYRCTHLLLIVRQAIRLIVMCVCHYTFMLVTWNYFHITQTCIGARFRMYRAIIAMCPIVGEPEHGSANRCVLMCVAIILRTCSFPFLYVLNENEWTAKFIHLSTQNKT